MELARLPIDHRQSDEGPKCADRAPPLNHQNKETAHAAATTAAVTKTTMARQCLVVNALQSELLMLLPSVQGQCKRVLQDWRVLARFDCREALDSGESPIVGMSLTNPRCACSGAEPCGGLLAQRRMPV